MTSRERMLTALSAQAPDYPPCSFMIFAALREQSRDEFDFVRRQLDMGLDARVQLPDLPIRVDPPVRIEQWKESPSGGVPPLLHKRYITPAGELATAVRQTEDWPYGDSVPLFDDYLIPRSQKFLITREEDLESLRYLFADPTNEDLATFRREARQLKEFGRQNQLLIAGGWQTGEDAGVMGGDAVMWLCGMQEAVLLAMDEPHIIAQMVAIIAAWNRRRMEVILDEGIDLIVKRAWYEGTGLWSPALYRRFMLPVLTEEVQLAHQAGAKFGYIMTSGVMPILEDIIGAGVDALIGVDPLEGKGTDLAVLKQKAAGKMCLWGGANGFLTVEMGTPEQAAEAVREALGALAAGGGFILSPVDNVTESTPAVWRNVEAFIAAWRKYREQGL